MVEQVNGPVFRQTKSDSMIKTLGRQILQNMNILTRHVVAR